MTDGSLCLGLTGSSVRCWFECLEALCKAEHAKRVKADLPPHYFILKEVSAVIF